VFQVLFATILLIAEGSPRKKGRGWGRRPPPRHHRPHKGHKKGKSASFGINFQLGHVQDDHGWGKPKGWGPPTKQINLRLPRIKFIKPKVKFIPWRLKPLKPRLIVRGPRIKIY